MKKTAKPEKTAKSSGRKKLFMGLGAALLFAAVFLSAKDYFKEPPLWGAYTGGEPGSNKTFEERIGEKMDLAATFVHWGNKNEFPLAFAKGLEEDQTLVIFWEAMDYNRPMPNQPEFSYDVILSGGWDSYISSFAEAAKNYGREVILVPFGEMNGDWPPWAVTQNSNTPEKHILAWRHIHGFFKEVPNVKFGWAVNSSSIPETPENQPENYYPGSEYVDYVGVNGFNFGDPWLGFDEIFKTMLKNLSAYKKPIYIFSMASAEGEKKPSWIKDAIYWQIPKYNLAGWIWFNEQKEKDWRVWSDEDSLRSFKNSIK